MSRLLFRLRSRVRALSSPGLVNYLPILKRLPVVIQWAAAVLAVVLLIWLIAVPLNFTFWLYGNLEGVVAWLNESTTHKVVGFGVFTLFGVLAFTLRLHGRSTYGQLEVVAAFLTLNYAVEHPKDGKLGTFCAMLAAVYLLVRGLDNWREGVKAAAEERAAEEKAAQKT